MPNSFEHCNILICDDSLANVMVLSNLIQSQLNVGKIQPITNPEFVIPELEKQHYDLLILDYEMPGLSGSEVLNRVRQRWSMEQFPVIIITGNQDFNTRTKTLSGGANDFMTKPFHEIEVCLRVKNILQIHQANMALDQTNQRLEAKVQERTQELEKANDYLIYCLSSVGEFRDSETAKHVVRVGKYSGLLARALGLSADLVFMIEKAAPLHDIGKVGIPDRVLLKPTRLDEKEWQKMQRHVGYGYKILNGSDSLVIKMAQSIAISHHERWDGKGYPRKLAGEAIPVEGRITALADVFDALVSKRPYKDPWSFDDVVEHLKAESGKAFDPTLVQLFIDNIDQVKQIHERYAD